MHVKVGNLARAALLVLCGVVVCSCGRGGNDNQASAPKGQIVARVGDQLITTAELDNEFRLANVPADKQKDPETLKRILTDLVARKHLFSQALKDKLDREPSVLLDLLRSRESVLANAMVTRTATAKVSAISQTDVDRYITSNPSKFANRQLFSVEQITFPMMSNIQAVLDTMTDKKSLDDVDQQLTAMNVPHARSVGSIGGGDIPENLVAQMRARKPGDVFFFRAGANGMFLVVKNEELRPVGGEAAQNLARQTLRADLFKSELGAASVAANLEAKYEGEYISLMNKPADLGATQK